MSAKVRMYDADPDALPDEKTVTLLRKEKTAAMRQSMIRINSPVQRASLLFDIPRKKTFLLSEESFHVLHKALTPINASTVQNAPQTLFILTPNPKQTVYFIFA